MLKLSTPNIDQEEINAVNRVLKSGNLVYGNIGRELEQRIARHVGTSHAIAVTSGTAALHLSLYAMGVGPGDGVIVPSYSFPASANSIRLCGATPIFTDVSSQNYCMSINDCKAAYEAWEDKGAIKAIMPVHEFGSPCDMDQLCQFANEHELSIIEDAACALGADIKGKFIGSFGDTGCFSFHPRKSMTTGEGGAIVTNNDALAHKLRSLRNHGINYTPSGPAFDDIGYNYRLTDIQSAIGLPQLRKLPNAIQKRRKLKATYDAAFKNTTIRTPEHHKGHSWQTYMVVLPEGCNRNAIIDQLRARGIESNLGAHSILETEAYAADRSSNVSTPVAKHLFEYGLALPFCESYTQEQLSYVADELIEAVSA